MSPGARSVPNTQSHNGVVTPWLKPGSVKW